MAHPEQKQTKGLFIGKQYALRNVHTYKYV